MITLETISPTSNKTPWKVWESVVVVCSKEEVFYRNLLLRNRSLQAGLPPTKKLSRLPWVMPPGKAFGGLLAILIFLCWNFLIQCEVSLWQTTAVVVFDESAFLENDHDKDLFLFLLENQRYPGDWNGHFRESSDSPFSVYSTHSPTS